MKKICCLDTEFTVIESKRVRRTKKYINSEVIQIGAVIINEEGTVIRTFSEYVKPEFTSVAPSCRKITHITDTKLRKALSFNETVKKFLDWIGSLEDLVVYAWSEADYHQLQGEAIEKKLTDTRFLRFLNSMDDYQQIFHDRLGISAITQKKMSLENAAYACGIDFNTKKHHDALQDSITLSQIYSICSSNEKFHTYVSGLYDILHPTDTPVNTIGEMFPNIFNHYAVVVK